MRTHRPVLIALGALLAVVGLGGLGAGLGLTWAHATQRDADGFYTSPAYSLSTDGFAITTEDLVLTTHPGDWFAAPGELTFRVRVEATATDRAVFVGLGDRAEVDAYLDDVLHSQVSRVGMSTDDVTYRNASGTTVPAAPAGQDLWVATSEGTGPQVVTVDAQPGDWTLVVMNPDASPGVAVGASAGVKSTLLLPIGMGLLVAAALMLAAATAVLVAGAGGPRQPAPAASPDPANAAPPGSGGHPVHLTGRLDPDLSRGLWLVKWMLALPHLLVLALLWLAFAVLTVVAGLAILFTARYPRSIFEFNVGVMRWTWRVTYYAFGVLGTDQYPPFTLWADPDFPATLDVGYPEELSRGLVLVKWLLALPHYVIVGIFTGGLVAWTFDLGVPGGLKVVAGNGLVGVLVLVAAIALTFRGRYPEGVYDLVMGLQRWVYRVTAYAALMTDDYPPFRLDTGGAEPSATGGPDRPSDADGGEHRELLDA